MYLPYQPLRPNASSACAASDWCAGAPHRAQRGSWARTSTSMQLLAAVHRAPR